MTDHAPRHCSRQDQDDEPFVDNHSGTRLLLVLLMLPLAVFAGWGGYRIGWQIATALESAVAGRIGYAVGGAAMLAVVFVFLRWQYALSPRVQSHAREFIDDMSEEPADDDSFEDEL
jgi:hypothetical protein